MKRVKGPTKAAPRPRQRARRFQHVNDRWSFAETLETEALDAADQDCYPTREELDPDVDPATAYYRYAADDGDNEELVDPNPPLSEMTASQLRDVYENVDRIAQLVEQRTIRPSDRVQRALARQNEADNASGAASVSLLKNASGNRRYAAEEPVPWCRALQTNQLDFANSLSVDSHVDHPRDLTVLLDVGTVHRTRDVPLLHDARRHSETFRYAALPVGIVGPLQESSVHADALLLENGNASQEPLDKLTASGTMPLGAVLRLLVDRSGFSLFAVYVRGGDALGFVDVALALEPSNSLFLLVTLHAERAARNPQTLCNGICAEMAEARRHIAENEEEAQKRSFDTPRHRALEKHINEHRRKLRLAASFHVDHRTLDTGAASLGELLCARSTLLTVFAPEYSRTLQALEVRVLYCAFASCQCRFDADDLCTLYGIDKAEMANGPAIRTAPAGHNVFADFERRAEQRRHGDEQLEAERTQAMFSRTEAHTSVPQFQQ